MHWLDKPGQTGGAVDPDGQIAVPSDVGGPTGEEALTGLGATLVMVAGVIATGGATSTAGAAGGAIGTAGGVILGRDESIDFFTCGFFYPIHVYDLIFNYPPKKRPPGPPLPPRPPVHVPPCFTLFK